MDKYEYKLRLEEIRTLNRKGRFQEAAKVADTVDWNKVRNVSTLCVISDVYKINRRFEDAKGMLLLANGKSPQNRRIIYALCDLTIKMGQVVEAVEYYKEFVQLASNDNSKYILLYKIYEAQDISLEERIAVLKEYKKREYNEKWAYELAFLYHRIGLATECVEECDQLILWFGEGKYVVKAMELKRLYTELSPAQQQTYDRITGKKDAGAKTEESQDNKEEAPENSPKAVVSPTPEKKDEELDIQVKTMDMGQYNTINLQMALAESMKEVMAPLPEGEEEQLREKAVRLQQAKKARELQAAQETRVIETPRETQKKAAREERFAAGLPKEMEGLLAQEYNGQISLALPEERVSEKQITGQMNLEDVLDEWERLKQDNAQKRKQDTLEWMKQQTGSLFAEFEQQTKDGILEKLQREGESRGETAVANGPAGRSDLRDKGPSAIGKSAETEVPADTEALDEIEALDDTEELEEIEALADTEELNEIGELPVTEELEAIRASTENVETKEGDSTSVVREAEVHVDLKDTREAEENDKTLDLPEEGAAGVAGAVQPESDEGMAAPPAAREAQPKTGQRGQSASKAPTGGLKRGEARARSADLAKSPARMVTAGLPKDHARAAAARLEDTVEFGARIREAQLREHIRSMSREEKELFAPFMPTKGAMRQLVKALDTISLSAFTGNMIITGATGSDMMPLARNVIRTVRAGNSNFSGKIAKVSGEVLNKKDAAQMIAKIAGGALIVEKAGKLSEQGAAGLAAALNQEHTGVIVFLLDSKRAIERLMTQSPQLAESFNARFDIAALDSATLVKYGCQYAYNLEYAIDELGRLALHTRIEELQTSEHAVTVEEVREIVDEAIAHAERKSLHHFTDVLLHRRYDDDDMIVLRERDFI